MKAEEGRKRGERKRGHMEGEHRPEAESCWSDFLTFLQEAGRTERFPLLPVGGAEASCPG